MGSVSNQHGGSLSEVLGAVLEGTAELLVVDPSAEAVEQLVEVASAAESPPTMRVLAREGVLKRVMDDFLVASNAADLIQAGVLELRTAAGIDSTLLVTDEAVRALVSTADRVAALAADDEAFVDSARETYEDRWAAAEEYRLRTPAMSRVRESLEAEIGPKTREDFEGVLSSLETARGDGDGLDEVTISLLVAAKNEELLYDISRWGEDVGIASKATFSRTKSRLEDLGLIDTEKVPIDVGRPRLRLKLADESLQGADAAQLASVAQSIIAS